MKSISEAKELLINRIGWRDDKTVTGFIIYSTNKETDSGRFFQDEHSVITLSNIRDCQPIVSISNDDFNEYLGNLKRQVIYQVLSDVFEKDRINDKLFDLYISGFDNLISLRMVLLVSELMTSTTRFNVTERFSKDFLGKLNHDIFGNSDKSISIHSMGISSRYGFELNSVRRRFGSQRNQLKSITKGEVFNEFYNHINDRY